MDSQTGVRTLIVEASELTRRSLRARLEVIGCAVVGEAENQKIGVDLFRKLRPQIVTLDASMPQIDGFTTEQLFKIMRTENPNVSIILISSGPKPLTATKYIAQGAIEYQEKPFVNFDRIRDKLGFLYPHLALRRDSRMPASRGYPDNHN